jgi:hypothetical protein
VCVLLGDGSGGVFFLVSSRSVSYWSRKQWGGIFFGVRSEVVFSSGSVPRVYFFACLLAVFQERIMFGGAGPAESMAGETSQQRN